MKLVTNKFKSGRLHEKHVVTTCNHGNHHSICLYTQGKQEKHVSRLPVDKELGRSQWSTYLADKKCKKFSQSTWGEEKLRRIYSKLEDNTKIRCIVLWRGDIYWIRVFQVGNIKLLWERSVQLWGVSWGGGGVLFSGNETYSKELAN